MADAREADSRKQPGPVAADAVLIDGVQLTHPDKVLWPAQGLTKRDLAGYFNRVADRMLPHLAQRPLTLLRYPSGRQAQCYVQRHAAEGSAASLRRYALREARGIVEYLAVDSRLDLLALVQMGVLEISAWTSRADKPDRPDRLILDLDPAETVGWEEVVATALALRRRLRQLDIDCFVMATGGRGLHIMVPIARRLDWDATLAVARALATAAAEEEPKRRTVSPLSAQKAGRLFIDIQRNARGQGGIAPYSPRVRSGATVATPLTWEELETLTEAPAFTVRSIPERLRVLGGDPWAVATTLQQSFTSAARRTLGV